MDCPKCGSEHYVKDGIANRRRRYKCKKCDCRYMVKRKSSKIPDSIRRFAVQLYPEGLGFRLIERPLGVSHAGVTDWVAGFAVGDGSKKIGESIWRSMTSGSVELASTDHWKVCGEFVPPSKHFDSKAERFAVEGCNARIRDYLARFGRKTKCYSKSQKMMFHSFRLLMQKRSGDPYFI